MRTLDLYRMRENGFATYGRIEKEDRSQLCVTIEKPWVDANHDGHRDRNVSRVVAGSFLCKRIDSPKHGDCFELQNVPDCDDCEIHVACLPRDLRGCIGVGLTFGPVQYPDMNDSQPGVTHSRDAFKLFMAEMHGVDSFILNIHDVAKVAQAA